MKIQHIVAVAVKDCSLGQDLQSSQLRQRNSLLTNGAHLKHI